MEGSWLTGVEGQGGGGDRWEIAGSSRLGEAQPQ